MFLLPLLLPKNYRYQILNTYGHNTAFSIVNNRNKKMWIIVFDRNEESNYNHVNNPILIENKLNVNPNSLKVLYKLAFKSILHENDDSNEKNEINIVNNAKEKDYDKEKNKNNDATNLNQVSKKILIKCNVFNNSCHKSKGVKLWLQKEWLLKNLKININ